MVLMWRAECGPDLDPAFVRDTFGARPRPVIRPAEGARDCRRASARAGPFHHEKAGVSMPHPLAARRIVAPTGWTNCPDTVHLHTMVARWRNGEAPGRRPGHPDFPAASRAHRKNRRARPRPGAAQQPCRLPDGPQGAWQETGISGQGRIFVAWALSSKKTAARNMGVAGNAGAPGRHRVSFSKKSRRPTLDLRNPSALIRGELS